MQKNLSRRGYEADAEQSAASERINPRPILTTAAAEWEAFHVRLWSAIDGCLAGALTDEELRKFKSLGMAGA